MENAPSRAIFLAGPTAAGKSAVAMALCEMLGGEIISVDSMQVYQGLDIGTAKPSAADRQRVRHHLIDVVTLKESFDAAQFVRLARVAAQEIEARGRRPIFCGGTGLYFKAYLEGLGPAPPKDASIRTELEATPPPQLLEELERCDPVAFQTLDLSNPRRVIRALEVIRLTGQPFSAQRAQWSVGGRPGASMIGLTRPAGELAQRIHERVDEMFRQGLVAETESLLAQCLAENPTAMQALGYRQVVEHLRGLRRLPETIELVKIRTRQFAKRQLTWFRRQMNLEWITLSDTSPGSAVAALAEKFSN
ncbi:MAG TPA: tRNA (adenosine(37)-N6)-dimethylallyltransferase MiaA [Verrucomicrobiae bacterium]|jgi:tRNA dimethylallyltransferase|nr:tRNA (adenosine(37)-N6)-dimethylallyltransferase MiaA [Verrucomicrobiae bacterium]